MMTREVSIHAPARGATRGDMRNLGQYFVSIHAPARGATAFFSDANLEAVGFNPRTREGCD